MIFVDTNYFLRFLRADVVDQYEKAKSLFRSGATGKKKLFTSTVVIFELYWVLTSFYKKDKKDIATLLLQILNMQFLDIEERSMLQKAGLIYQEGSFDLEDAYNLVYAKTKGAKEFKTFDKKLQRAF